MITATLYDVVNQQGLVEVAHREVRHYVLDLRVNATGEDKNRAPLILMGDTIRHGEIRLRVGQRNYEGENIFGHVLRLTGLYGGTIPPQPFPELPQAEIHYYDLDRTNARRLLVEECFELD